MANLTSKPHGVYRDRGEGVPSTVYVSYGAHGFPVSEAYYLEQHFEPALDTVPWKDEQLAKDAEER